jgi:hypothetical protein
MEKKPFSEDVKRDWGFFSPAQVGPVDPTEVAAINNPATLLDGVESKLDPLGYLPGSQITAKVGK